MAQKHRPLGGDQLSGLQAFEDLPVAFVPQANRDLALGETAAVGGGPYYLSAVSFPHHAVKRNRNGAHGIAGADHEIREHARQQFVLWILDLGPQEPPTGIWLGYGCD